jgi:hypothetical protein
MNGLKTMNGLIRILIGITIMLSAGCGDPDHTEYPVEELPTAPINHEEMPDYRDTVGVQNLPPPTPAEKDIADTVLRIRP